MYEIKYPLITKKISPLKPRELSCFGLRGNDNDNSVWELEIDGNEWKYNGSFKLKHKNTGFYLTTYINTSKESRKKDIGSYQGLRHGPQPTTSNWPS